MSYKISQELLDQIVHRIGDEVVSMRATEFDVRANYSGRGMYGKNCIGFVIDSDPMFFVMGLGVILADMENADDLFTVDDQLFGWYDLRVASDSMGMSTIVYFPNLSLDS